MGTVFIIIGIGVVWFGNEPDSEMIGTLWMATGLLTNQIAELAEKVGRK